MKRTSALHPLAMAAALAFSLPAWAGPVGPARDVQAARRLAPPAQQLPGAATQALERGAAEQPKVLGRTYGEWAAEWVAWSESGPIGQNAIQDLTGEFCGLNQPGRNVWFLAGSFGVPQVERHCSIPRGRALFYPIYEAPWIDCPGTVDETLTDAEVRDIMAAYIGEPAEISSSLNGVAVVSLQVPIVRTQTPVFTNVLPNSHVLVGVCPTALSAGRTGRRIGDGYWVMLPPLPAGQHTLSLRGAQPGFETSVTYRLTVR